MSVRMVVAKLAVMAAAGALIGGGAVHHAEKQKPGALHYIKHGKPHPHHAHPRPRPAPAPSPCTGPMYSQPDQAQPNAQPGVGPTPCPTAPPAGAWLAPHVTPTEEAPQPPQVAEQNPPYPGWMGPWGGGRWNTSGGYVASSGGHHGGSTGGTTGGTKVPGPPMLVLFGAAASALARRRRQATKQD